MEGDYIDYKKIIPGDYKTSIKTETKTFIDSVERAALIITSEVTKDAIENNKNLWYQKLEGENFLFLFRRSKE